MMVKTSKEISAWLDLHTDNKNHDKGQELAQLIHETSLEFMELFGVDVTTDVIDGGMFGN